MPGGERVQNRDTGQGMIHVQEGQSRKEGTKFHHLTQNGTQFKPN